MEGGHFSVGNEIFLQSASGNSLDFSVSLKNLENTPFYSVRIVAIGKDGSVGKPVEERGR